MLKAATAKKWSKSTSLWTFDFHTCFVPRPAAEKRAHFERCIYPQVFRKHELVIFLNSKYASHSGGALCSMMKGNRRTVARNGCKITRHIVTSFILKFCFLCRPRAIFENYESWKVLWTSQSWTILASTCSSCLGRVLFLTLEAIKNGSAMVCLHNFDFQLCFAPRTRAIFHCWICQKCFGPAAFFWLLRHYWELDLPKVVPGFGVLAPSMSKCASRQALGRMDIQCDSSAWGLRTGRLLEVTFWAMHGHQTLENTALRGSPNISYTDAFWHLLFSFDLAHILSLFFWLSLVLTVRATLAAVVDIVGS